MELLRYSDCDEVAALCRQAIQDAYEAANSAEGTIDLALIETRVQERAEELANQRAKFRIDRERRRAWVHVWTNAGIIVVLATIGIATSSGTVGDLLSGFLFVSWIWLTVAIFRASTRNDRTRATAVREARECAQMAFEQIGAYLDSVEGAQRAEVLEQRRLRGVPAPDPQPFGVSHEGAEALVAEWIRHLGAVDAEVTRLTGDGGIDVESSGYIAQVKNYAGAVGVSELRELAGVAAVDGRTPLFFTSGTLTAEASLFAEAARIAAFRYDAIAGQLDALNDLGAAILRHGLEV